MRKTQAAVILILTAPLWIPLAVIFMAGSLLLRVALHAAAWCRWKRLVLFVYSDSPNWKDALESSVLPRLPEGSVVLNSSKRAGWRPWSLRVLLFRVLSGRQDHTPIALVIHRFGWVRRYRFFRAFQEAKKGRLEKLRNLEERLFRDLSSAKGSSR